MTHQPTLRTPAEGRTIAVVGDVYRFLVTAENTNGKYALWEAIVPPGGGPPPHVHSREEEGFYILEGDITFQIGDERIVATAGICKVSTTDTTFDARRTHETSPLVGLLASSRHHSAERLYRDNGDCRGKTAGAYSVAADAT